MTIPRMLPDDLSRRFFLDICANGTVHIREAGAPGGASVGLLPVFSTDTYEEANMLRVRHCRLASDGSGVYGLNDPPMARVVDAKRRDAVEDLGRISEMFRASYSSMLARQTERTRDVLRDPKVRRAALDILDQAEKIG